LVLGSWAQGCNGGLKYWGRRGDYFVCGRIIKGMKPKDMTFVPSILLMNG